MKWRKPELRKACQARSISPEGTNQQLVEKLKSWAKKGGALGFNTITTTPQTPSKRNRSSSNDEVSGTPSKRRLPSHELGTLPIPTKHEVQKEDVPGEDETLKDQLTDNNREAIKFQGGHNGDKEDSRQALNGILNSNFDGGGSSGEDTCQGGLSNDGGGQMGQKSSTNSSDIPKNPIE